MNVWTAFFIYIEKGTNLVFFRVQEYISEFRKMWEVSAQADWLFDSQGRLIEYVYNGMITSVSYLYLSKVPEVPFN